MSTPADVDAYVAAQPEPVRAVLEQVRATLHDAVSGLEETIKYSMPTMTLDGKSLVHFAAWKHHLSVYPWPEGDATLAPYASGSGTGKIPYVDPFPLDLVRRAVLLLREQRG
jgi:uncharacterized protein YdhG (YjbR/CyaY superfamily)